jgi:hypothetical protein
MSPSTAILSHLSEIKKSEVSETPESEEVISLLVNIPEAGSFLRTAKEELPAS